MPDCDVLKRRTAEALCAPIKDPNGDFAPCHATVDPKKAYDNCVYDTCRDTTRDTCENMKDYADSCSTEGASLAWRKPTRCCESLFVVEEPSW